MNNIISSLYNIDKYELSQPEWLWLIPLFVITNITLIFLNKSNIEKSQPASLIEASTDKIFTHPLLSLLQIKGTSKKKNPFFNIIYSVVFTLVIISLAQPVKIGEELPEPPQERDITFIVDSSVSMILRDYILNGERIDRMSLLKGVLSEFINKLNGERMSIIVFGDKAYTLVPLTSDQHLLQRMLSRVQATMAGRFNAIGDAIALAVKQSTTYNNIDGITRKRILVLLTDADQPTGNINPVDAANLAAEKQLPLYTIAIGATSLASDESRTDGLLYSPVNLNLLKKLSSSTNAKSFHAGNPNALNNAIQNITLHDTNKRKIQPQYYREALYFRFLIAAFILFSIYQLALMVRTTLISAVMVEK